MFTPIQTIIRALILQNRDMSVDEIVFRLEEIGFVSPSRFTVSTIRSDFKASLKLLDESGLLRHREPKLPPSIQKLVTTKKVPVDKRHLRRFESM